MKLGIVRQTYNSNGGAERFITRVMKALTQYASIDITIITRAWEESSGCKTLIINPPFYNRLSREMTFASECVNYFSQFDIVQSHERISGATIFRAGDGVHATWLEQFFRILSSSARLTRVFSRYHSYILRAEKNMFTHPQLRMVICNSKMVRNDIALRFCLPDDILTVIYNGVDITYFNPIVRSQSQRNELGIPQNVPVLTYIGSGFSRKGLATALQAIVPHTNVWLTVVGQDKNARKFEKLAWKLGVASRVRFLGPVVDIRQVYGTADALILPTLYDPFPNVCIEALACGLPIFISHSCGAMEWIEEGQNGWVRDALDIAGYQQAIAEWLKGLEQGNNYSLAARTTAEPYTLDRMATELQSLYCTLLKN